MERGAHGPGRRSAVPGAVKFRVAATVWAAGGASPAGLPSLHSGAHSSAPVTTPTLDTAWWLGATSGTVSFGPDLWNVGGFADRSGLQCVGGSARDMMT